MVTINRPMPNSPESEMALLGAMILDPKVIADVSCVVTAGDFYDEHHASIFASMVYIERESGGLDLVLLLNDLRAGSKIESIGGVAYLEKLAAETPGPTGAMHWARSIRQFALQRRIIEVASEVSHSAYNARTLDDARELAGIALDRFCGATKDIDTGRALDVADAARSILADLQAQRRYLVSSGFPWFDSLSGGIPEKGVMTVIGHPSHGKTTWALTLMAHLASMHGGGGVVHSVEQGPERVAGTLLSVHTGLPVHSWMNAGHVPSTIEQHAIGQGIEHLRSMKLTVEPDSMDASEIYRRATRSVTKGVRRIMVDYIQDLKPMPGIENGAEAMAESMRWLARIGTELGMLCIVISQVDKAARSMDRAPRLNDSRGSAAIADRTDIGVSVYRPHFNARPEDQFDVISIEKKRALTEFTVCKNKYGSLGTATVRFEGSSMRFVEEGV